jgi:hypothetical protein
VFGDITAFEEAVKLIIQRLTFDYDKNVSMFETNIRMMGQVDLSISCKVLD